MIQVYFMAIEWIPCYLHVLRVKDCHSMSVKSYQHPSVSAYVESLYAH